MIIKHLTYMMNCMLPALKRMAVVAVWAVALAVALSSCTDDKAEPQPLPEPGTDKEVNAGFYITVGDVVERASGSRATPAGDYDPGAGLENYIDIDGRDFRFIFFSGDADGRNATYVAEMEVTSVIPVQFTQYSKTYKVSGSVSKSLVSGSSFRVMVMANWGSYPTLVAGMSTIDDACRDAAALYEFTAEKVSLGTDKSIPLYGIQRYENVQFDALDYANLGTIHLLRAYAKVDVQMKAGEKRWALKSVQLLPCNSMGYRAPLGVYDRADYVKDSYDADYTGTNPSIPAEATGAELDSVPFVKVNAEGTIYRAYIPEFRNIDANGNPLEERAKIRVRFTDRNTGFESYLGEQYLEFANYDGTTGKPTATHYNVMRNYWYKYTITKGDEITDVKVQLDVQPYASVELDPMFGLERDPIDGYIVLKKGMIDGVETPTFLYDDRFEEYYDFQKYLLLSNYSDQIARISDEKKTELGLTGDIWLIKRANGEHDGIKPDNTSVPSLLYDADTGIYYDFEGTPLNLIYSKRLLFDRETDLPAVADSIVEVDRDFQHNDIALLRGESDRVAVYYDFSDKTYKGATDFNEADLPRRPLKKYQNGWIEVKPYDKLMDSWIAKGWITAADKANVKPMYFNLYTERFYDTGFYSLHSPDYTVQYYVDSPYVTLTHNNGKVVRYNRVTGVYMYIDSEGKPMTERPSDLWPSRVPIPGELATTR